MKVLSYLSSAKRKTTKPGGVYKRWWTSWLIHCFPFSTVCSSTICEPCPLQLWVTLLLSPPLFPFWKWCGWLGKLLSWSKHSSQSWWQTGELEPCAQCTQECLEAASAICQWGCFFAPYLRSALLKNPPNNLCTDLFSREMNTSILRVICLKTNVTL